MKYDITALGEILIDFAPVGKDSFGDTVFARKAGGAPLNLLATVSKYGGKAAFIGKVGKDMFGDFLHKTLTECGISDTGLKIDPLHNTTLAFVDLDENGDRSFSFYRNLSADISLERSDINEELISNSGIFHFGSLSLTDEPARSATEYAVNAAKKSGALITYDPNYRPALWKDADTAVKMMKKHLSKVDILKISKEELEMMFGIDREAAVKRLFYTGVKIILVTDGANGASLYMNGFDVSLPAAKVKTVDTTGAGDIFFGTFISEWIKNGSDIDSIKPQTAAEFLKKAIEVSGKSTEKYSAIASIPNYERNER